MPGVCTSAEPLRDPRHELLDNSAQDMQIKKTLVWNTSITRVFLCIDRSLCDYLANALCERGMEIFHRLDTHTLAASGCMNIGAIFNIDTYVIHTRSGTPKEQVAGLQFIHRNRFTKSCLAGSGAREFHSERLIEAVAGESRAVESARSGAAVGIGAPFERKCRVKKIGNLRLLNER